MLRQFATCACVLLLPAQAVAADWWLVAYSNPKTEDRAIGFIDKESIRADGPLMRASRALYFQKLDGQRRYRIYDQVVNCADQTSGIVSNTQYDDAGQQTKPTVSTTKPKMEFTEPDSNGRDYLEFICGRNARARPTSRLAPVREIGRQIIEQYAAAGN